MNKYRARSVLPGALWHIFHPSDTPKIRDLLNKVRGSSPGQRSRCETLRTSELTGEVDVFQDVLGVLDPVAVDGRRDVDEEVDGVRHVDVKICRRPVAVQRGAGKT